MAEPNTSGEKPAPIIDSRVDSSQPQKYDTQVNMGGKNVGRDNLMSQVTQQPKEAMKLPGSRNPLGWIKGLFHRPQAGAENSFPTQESIEPTSAKNQTNKPDYRTPLTPRKAAVGLGVAAGAVGLAAVATGGLSGRGNETPDPTSPNEPEHTQTMETLPSMQTPVGIEEKLNAPPTSTPTQIPEDAGAPETFEEAKDFVPNTTKPKP